VSKTSITRLVTFQPFCDHRRLLSIILFIFYYSTSFCRVKWKL